MFGHRRVLVVEVDRDSVAMGDDMRSHAYRETLRDGALLATVLEQVHPEILSLGWSWVAVVDGTVSAVWSVDHGVQLLVQNRRLRAGEPATRVFFRYFLQIDPQWLHQRLASGAAPDREALNEEYAPIAAERLEAEQRRREREVPQKLLSTQGIEALVRLGATIDLHSDTRCRLDAHGVRWTLVRSDTMTLVYRADTRYSVASIRPMSFAELWLATAIGARRRQQLGVTPLPSVELRPSPALKAMHPPGSRRATMVGAGPGPLRRSTLRRRRSNVVPLRVRPQPRRDRRNTHHVTKNPNSHSACGSSLGQRDRSGSPGCRQAAAVW